MIQVGLVGHGYWGKNLLRNFYHLPDSSVSWLCDSNEKQLAQAKKNYADLRVTTDYNDLLKDPKLDAVIIATPVFTHYELAKKALEAGKNVLVEKPMTSTVAQAEELIELAQKKKKLIMPDHTFLYTGAVKKMKELISSGAIGKINYIDSTRINLGLFQPDVNVLWDLAPHDISICDYLVEEKPYSVQATGISHTNNGIENIAYLTVNYNSNMIAHFNCSWTSPVKVRNMLIGGDKKMILYNDLETTEKIKIYDTGYELRTEEDKIKIMVDYRTGDIYVPKLDFTEALTGMAQDFVSCIASGNTPKSNAALGLSVVKILEASQQSIKQKGKEIIL